MEFASNQLCTLLGSGTAPPLLAAEAGCSSSDSDSSSSLPACSQLLVLSLDRRCCDAYQWCLQLLEEPPRTSQRSSG